MARIAVSRVVAAPREQVWAVLADLGSHGDWMGDARSVVFTTEVTTGVGTRMEVETRVGPFHTRDVLEVVGWDEGKTIEVAHHGVIRGRGTLSASAEGKGTRVTWEEKLVFPWWLGGAVTAWLARPILVATWRGNLRELSKLVESA